ncbi:Hydra magnipapillata [Nesidiocoris tenuis]|uniref:Hydra magnipapillata n=1 Tax=Nesidiocoris tenuis TaxID=355587 RepID=A0ABN7AJ29_9HEMI|nr:Hydra magnipapillata [Nesidiocoris tenuis]
MNLRRPEERRPPFWTKDYYMYMANEEFSLETQENESSLWDEAIQAEIKAHLKNGTWEIRKRPADLNVVGYRTILKEKLKPDGTLERRKARLVAQGFSQRPGLDYSETYSLVLKMKSLRLLMGIAANEDLELTQMDVTTAYLNGTLDEQIFMKILEGLEENLHKIMIDKSQKPDKTIYEEARKMSDLKETTSEKACYLKKAIYVLKQAVVRKIR